MFKKHPYVSLYVFGSALTSIGAFFNYSNEDRISGGFVIFGFLMIALAITLGSINNGTKTTSKPDNVGVL